MIVWNKVTWYSKLLAVIFFLGILPAWTFFLGMKYEEAKSAYLMVDQNSQITPLTTNSQKVDTLGTTTPVGNTLPIDSGIKGVITVGPTCPVERIPPDPACANRPYPALLLITDENTGDNKTIKADSNGRYSINLPPGSYSIKNASTDLYPHFPDQKITVYSHQFSILNIQGDSGIR